MKPCLSVPGLKGYFIKELVTDHSRGGKEVAGGFILVGPDSKEVRFTWKGTFDGREWRISGPGAPLPSGGRVPDAQSHPFSIDAMLNRGIKLCLISQITGNGTNATALPPATPRSEQNGFVRAGHEGEHLSARAHPEPSPSATPVSSAVSVPTGNGKVAARQSSSIEFDPKWIPLYKRLTAKQKRVASLLVAVGSREVEEIAKRLNLEPGTVSAVCRNLQFFFDTPDPGPSLEAVLKKLFEHDATLAVSTEETPLEPRVTLAASNGADHAVGRSVEGVTPGEGTPLDLNALQLLFGKLVCREKQVAFLLSEGCDRNAIRERLGINSNNLSGILWRLRQRFGMDDGGIKNAVTALFAAVPYLREAAQREIPEQAEGTSSRQLDLAGLVANERSVALLMAQGCEVTQVAAKLNLPVETINTIAERLAQKIECAVKELPERVQVAVVTSEAIFSGASESAGKEQVSTPPAAPPVPAESPSNGGEAVAADARVAAGKANVAQVAVPAPEDVIFAELRALRGKLPEGYSLTFELSSDPHGTVRATAHISKI